MRRAAFIVALALFGFIVAPAQADVHVGVHVGIPAPPAFVYETAPHLVVVPGVPRVHYAPGVSANFFTYGSNYYTYDRGYWFIAESGHGPWRYVERRYVPAPVLRVPVRYYVVAPQHVRSSHWHGHAHGYGHGHGYGKARYHHGGYHGHRH